MKITVEFNNTEELLSFINTFGTKTVEEPKTEPVTKKKTTKKAEALKGEETKKEEKPKENVETEFAGVDETPTTDPIDTDEKTYTKKEVQDICKNKIKEGKQLEVKEIIAKHGAKNISSIAEAEYAAVIAEVEVL